MTFPDWVEPYLSQPSKARFEPGEDACFNDCAFVDAKTMEISSHILFVIENYGMIVRFGSPDIASPKDHNW